MSGPRADQSFDRTVLIYRSFLNWSASLLKKMQGNDKLTVRARLATMVRALDTYCGLFADVAAQKPDHLAICYDTWVADVPYRAEALAQLDLPEIDNSLGPVQRYGGGSSFQKDAAEASALETSARWRHMAEDAEYQSVLRMAALDGDLLSLVERFFPEDAARLVRVATLQTFSAEVLTS